MDQLGLKDSARANQLDCIISYFLTTFNVHTYILSVCLVHFAFCFFFKGIFNI